MATPRHPGVDLAAALPCECDPGAKAYDRCGRGWVRCQVGLDALMVIDSERPPCCDCGTTTADRSACPLCGRVFCQSCAEKEGDYASCCDMP